MALGPGSLPPNIRVIDGGGGGENDLEQRVKSLEGNMLQASLDLSYLKGKMEDMPTKDWVTTRLIWVVSAISAVVALVAAVQAMFLQ